MQTEELYLVIGCFGRREGEFIFCPSVSNRVLKVDDSLVYINEIMDYFEAVRLFDKPMFDTNAIRHFIYNMQDRYDQKVRRLWTEQEYHTYEKFIITHKSCGLYVRLVVSNSEEEAEDSHSEKPTTMDHMIVKGTKEAHVPSPELKLVRGRR